MATPQDARREQPNTYIVQNRSDEEELQRLQAQDKMFTAQMGGVLPELPDPGRFQHILDVGCGTGGWLIEVAETYPDIDVLIGVDASHLMVEHARAQAAAHHLSDRVEFHVMDALRILEFPGDFFDLINQRAGMSWLRTWDWGKLLQEYIRVARPGGVVRVIEGDLIPETNSPGIARIGELAVAAFYQSGHIFAPDNDSMCKELPTLLTRYSIEKVQARTHALDYGAGTEQWRGLFEDMRRGMRTVQPFLRKWTHVPDDYDALYQQVLDEMQRPDFTATWQLIVAWGGVPADKEQIDFFASAR
jgi:ubiquinone/menaquinone biosynthesis C-methylase UbiE